jgi:hypothetical protein
VAQRLDLNGYATTLKLREFIAGATRPGSRRDLTLKTLQTDIHGKGRDGITAQIDGSVLDHWS